LRSPVTGTWGGWPTRLQVACSVESCRKLASSVKINAQCSVRAFFLGWDTCTDASGPARWRWHGTAHGVVAVRKSPGGAAISARGQGDMKHRILPRSPRQSWATSRPRYPSHTPRDHCQECRRVVRVAAVSSPACFRTAILPVSPRLHELDIATTTARPSTAVLSESPPVHHWYDPRSSGRQPVTASPRDRRHPVLLPCSVGSTAYEYSDGDAAIEEARHFSSLKYATPLP
jgi:hypothetical protein